MPGSAIFSGPTTDESRSAFDGLGIVVGLEAEARLARRIGVPVAVGGGSEAGAVAASARLIADGARALLSFGLAGGLERSMRPGMLIVPDVVVTRDGHYPTHPPLASALGRVGGAVFGGNAIAATAEEKRALFLRTGAACIDLESAAVAEAAASRAIPFAVLRAICDPAERSLPQAALAALDRDGQIGGRRVAASALSHPRELPALLALAADALRARRALGRRVTVLARLHREGNAKATRAIKPV